jgi:hypothetical protein
MTITALKWTGLEILKSTRNENNPMNSAPLWTALYDRIIDDTITCYHIKFGHSKGPKVTRETAWKLARLYLKNNPKLVNLHDVRPGGPARNEW